MLVYSQEVMVVLIKTNPFLQELAELNHLSAFEIIIIIIQISNKSKFRESKSVFFLSHFTFEFLVCSRVYSASVCFNNTIQY